MAQAGEAEVWDLAPGAEAAARVVAQVGAAARAALEVCGRPANRALQRAVAQEAARAAEELVQVARVVEAETAVVRVGRGADPVVGLAAEAALADLAVDLAVELVAEEAAQAAAPVVRVSQESGWQRLQC